MVYFYRGFFLPPGPDPFYSLAFCTSAIEINLAIICASAPALRGLIRSWFPRFFSTRGKGYNYNYADTPGRGTNPYGGGSTATNITSRRKERGAVDGDSRHPNTLISGNGGSFALRDLKGSKTHTTVNSSPNASEEEIMTYNGIVRTTNVMVHYDQESQRQGSANRNRSPDRGSNLGTQRSVTEIP